MRLPDVTQQFSVLDRQEAGKRILCLDLTSTQNASLQKTRHVWACFPAPCMISLKELTRACTHRLAKARIIRSHDTVDRDIL